MKKNNMSRTFLPESHFDVRIRNIPALRVKFILFQKNRLDSLNLNSII